ncbi:MAG: threonylcarbamoyl-AMP synthase [Deltaproteobacteria bacterium]|nr:threonylcarbamoyl-AMP synthase [Deltaproteobacteria bacterium]
MLVSGSVTDIAALFSSRTGVVVAYPTETFYGLGAKISDRAAISKILAIKGREASMGIIVLVADMDMACAIAHIDQNQRELLQKFWPGPLSAILQARKNIHPLLAPGGKVALRISPHETAACLVRAIGPITSTSANLAGKFPARTAREVMASALELDGILDGGTTPGKQPSTLVDLTSWPPVCVREGVIPFQEIIVQ